MSLNVFMAICILGIDFLIYVFFQWTYGDKRRAMARKIAAHRNALQQQSPPIVITKGWPTSTNSGRLQQQRLT